MILRGGAGATAEQLTVGAPVSIHDVIATSKDSRAMIAFIDGSRTAIGAEAEMGIDNFNFNDLDLPTAMRQLARWYDLDLLFEGKVPDKVIRGEMGRDLNLSQVLKILDRMEVHFRLEGRKLIVSP